jgi:hypothetical protein
MTAQTAPSSTDAEFTVITRDAIGDEAIAALAALLLDSVVADTDERDRVAESGRTK